MITISTSRDCGNSPKSLLVQTLAIAIECGDSATFAQCAADNVVWAYRERGAVVGKTNTIALLSFMREHTPARIEVMHAISHGKVGATNGRLELENGDEVRFCHIVEFASVKGERIAKINSFYSDSDGLY